MKLRDIAVASRLAGGGGNSGPVSWNDLTDKPFYHEIQEQVYLVYTGFGYYEGRAWQQLKNPEATEYSNRFVELFGRGTVPGEYLAVWENSVSGEKIEWVVTMTRDMLFSNEAGAMVINYNRRFLMAGPATTEELAPHWTLTFCQRQEVLKTIDEKFLPINSGGASSWNDLTDKPFYEETKEVTLLENFTSADYEANSSYAPYIDLRVGMCTIVWNGRTFENVRVQMDSYGGYVNITEDDWYLEMYAGGTNEVTYLYSSDEQFTVSIYQTQHFVHEINQKYLPFHTVEPILGSVYLEGTFETIEAPLEDDPTNIVYVHPNPTQFTYLYVPIDGTMFRVVYDGVAYDVTYRQTYSSRGYFGARELYENWDFPFSVYTGGMYDSFARIEFTTPGPHTLTIVEMATQPTVVPIEAKYVTNVMPYYIEVDSYRDNYYTNVPAKEILQAFVMGRELRLYKYTHFTDTLGDAHAGVKFLYLDRAAANKDLTYGYFVFVARTLSEEEWQSLHLLIEDDQVTIYSETGNNNHETT